MFLNVFLVFMVLIKMCKDNFENFLKFGGKLNFIDVDVVFCYCRILFLLLMVLIEIL